ncbi:hypothetical protein ACJO19_23810 [Vibrio parahaemolyticus]|uniref:hypothetical protein n=2 Tax=Vibrio parahaemolyticus TaxID=670 RepID=UPI00387AB863
MNISFIFCLVGIFLAGLAWFISPHVPREFAHFVGLLGFPLIGYFFSQMFYGQGGIKPQVLTVFILYAVISFVLGLERIFWIGGYYIFPLVAFFVRAFIAKKKTIQLKSLKGLLFMSALLSFLPSIGWELIIQPLIDVYGKPARGYVQWGQFSVDCLAVTAGLFGLWLIQRKKQELA